MVTPPSSPTQPVVWDKLYLVKCVNLQPMVGIFGLLGNCLSITVLSTKEMNNSFNKLLLSLSVFDSVFIIFVTFEYTFVRGKNRTGDWRLCSQQIDLANTFNNREVDYLIIQFCLGPSLSTACSTPSSFPKQIPARLPTSGHNYDPSCVQVIYPLNDICLCCSIYTTIAVSYER